MIIFSRATGRAAESEQTSPLLLPLLAIEDYRYCMADKEMIQEKIGEAIGLEKAAQKAVEELVSRGLLKLNTLRN